MRLLILKFHFCDLNSSWEMMVDKAVLELQMTYLAWLRSSWLSEMRSGGTSQAGENSFPFLFLFSFGEKSLFFFLFFYCENSFLFLWFFFFFSLLFSFFIVRISFASFSFLLWWESSFILLCMALSIQMNPSAENSFSRLEFRML